MLVQPPNLWQGPKIHTREKTASLSNSDGSYLQKNESKELRNKICVLNLIERVGLCLSRLGIGQDLLNRAPIAQVSRPTIKKRRSHESSLQKNTINQVKRKTAERGKMSLPVAMRLPFFPEQLSCLIQTVISTCINFSMDTVCLLILFTYYVVFL